LINMALVFHIELEWAANTLLLAVVAGFAAAAGFAALPVAAPGVDVSPASRIDLGGLSPSKADW